ncbi:MAG: bifunctional deaminase-reductase domain protein [Gemmatimonadetes bacterium]|nr:bifunctional deaminase-reductase domain protein [Gemmatimonadota bacterium]
MRIVSYGAACSLDGFIAGADGSIDWLHFSKDVHDIMGAYWKSVDLMVMGRKTWDVSVAMHGGGAARKKKKAPAKRADEKITTYVFSRTLSEIDQHGVRLVSSDPGAFIRDLKDTEGKGICVMGGGELAQSLFEAGVIDEVGLNVHPVLLGTGVPLFRDAGRRIQLKLKESKVLDGGCVFSNYTVASQSIPQIEAHMPPPSTPASDHTRHPATASPRSEPPRPSHRAVR